MSQQRPDRSKLPQAFWRAVEKAGMPASALLRMSRLPATLHLSERATLSTAELFALWRAVAEFSRDPAIGLRLVAASETVQHPPNVLAAFYARDYRDGLQRTARFKQLCSPEQLEFSEGSREFVITMNWLYAAEPPPPALVDVAFATLLELGRRGTGKHLVPVSVEYRRDETDGDAHRAHFGCPVRFGASRDALTLASADIDLPFPGHNPELLAILTPALASALEELECNTSVGERIKIVVKRQMASGRPELATIARELGMSERTLQRRVIEEGTTFRQLLNEARQELGRTLLRNPQADIDEIAFLLGYQDSSSFYRAFRDWEGTTPGQWRELNLSRDVLAAQPQTHH